MKKKILFLVLCLNLMIINIFAQNEIKVESLSEDSLNYYGISEFYFVHHIFADAFFRTDLYEQLDYNEMTKIVKTVLVNLNSQDHVLVIIKQDEGSDAKLLFWVEEKNQEIPVLVLMTNFHSKTRKFTEEMDEHNSLVRWYFIKDKKIVYRKDMYTKELEEEKKKEDSYSLIDFYFFDSEKSNDEKVYELIQRSLDSKKTTKVEKLYAKLYEGEYFQSNGEIDRASNSVTELKEYFEKNKGEDLPETYSFIIQMAETELEIMKRISKVKSVDIMNQSLDKILFKIVAKKQ